MIVADFAVIPMGKGTSASNYVRAVHDTLRESGIKYVSGPMSTTVEASDFEELSSLIKNANRRLADMGVERIITTLRIDYRLDKDISIESKLKKI